MTKANPLSRRDFLRYAVAGLGVTAAGGLLSGLTACSVPSMASHGDDAVSTTGNPDVSPDIELDLYAAPDDVQIKPGAPTRVWRYRAEVRAAQTRSGRPDAVLPIDNSYLGPILRFHKGETVRIHFHNELDEPSIVHWHGLSVPESADGHPRLAIAPGETYVYDFTVLNRAGTYWYHPHPHGRTGPQVLYGLAGLLLVTDDEESSLGLPDGAFDVPLVIQDRSFTDDNQFSYLEDGMQSPMIGFHGDEILVNGQPDFTLPVATRPYRLRLLNGSNARIYKLGWSDGRPFQVIATDGGLLERPVTRSTLTLAPGERVEVWADFGQDEAGTELVLQNLAFTGSQAFPILKVTVNEEASAQIALPEVLSTPNRHREADAVNRRNPRSFTMEMQHMAWLLNGRTFEMDVVARNEVVRLGDLEVWEFVNQSRHMAMPHPMHVHEVQFQVIEREVLPAYADLSRELSDGYVDEGWKDTVLLMPGERVKILLKFEHYEGLYLYHCHNLEHEDLGMMRNYRVKA
jgi:FtsP/CotA-like multicopper oxidase with cupredoxin domain